MGMCVKWSHDATLVIEYCPSSQLIHCSVVFVDDLSFPPALVGSVPGFSTVVAHDVVVVAAFGSIVVAVAFVAFSSSFGVV
eukprot:319808-Amphidinium_carterae.2